MMEKILCDSHVHVGQFYNIYHSPEEILLLMRRLHIDYIAVSSTTVCEENYPKVLSEIMALAQSGGGRVVPVLWLSPTMATDIDVLNPFLESGIGWRCVKVHGGLHKEFCQPHTKSMQGALKIAKQLDVPLLFHTGFNGSAADKRWSCEAISYREIIETHPRQTFILAHARPVEQTIEIMKSCSNAFADTAFSALEDVLKMIDEGLVDRVLWGTDLPIMSYFYGEKMSYKKYYAALVNNLRRSTSAEDFRKLTCDNFMNLFH